LYKKPLGQKAPPACRALAALLAAVLLCCGPVALAADTLEELHAKQDRLETQKEINDKRLEELERKLWRNLIYRLIATGIDIGVFIAWIVCILHTT